MGESSKIVLVGGGGELGGSIHDAVQNGINKETVGGFVSVFIKVLTFTERHRQLKPMGVIKKTLVIELVSLPTTQVTICYRHPN